MVRLMLAGLVLWAATSGPLRAECRSTVPSAIDFEGGRTVTILSHTARDVTYRSTLPDGSQMVMTTREGLFAISASHAGTVFHYEWLGELPRLADLKPGDQGSVKADMTVEQAQTSYITTTYKVLGLEAVTLQGCNYPVTVISRSDVIDGRTEAETTMWFSSTLRFPLRTESDASGKHYSYRAIGLR